MFVNRKGGRNLEIPRALCCSSDHCWLLLLLLLQWLTFQNSPPWEWTWTWTWRAETAPKAKFHRNGFFFSPSSALALACSLPAGILFIYLISFNLLNFPFLIEPLNLTFSSCILLLKRFSPLETDVFEFV